MEWIYTNNNRSTIINNKGGVVFLTFPRLVEAGVRHGFSTRAGGVSRGHLSSMNLSFNRGDDPDRVYENFRRISSAIGFCQDDLVLSAQEHHTRIRVVTSEDKGDGILRPTQPDVDGLVTNEPGIPLYTSYADCVPLLFFDPVHRVIAMAHSGWRGTVLKIGARMVQVMEREYGSAPEDLIAAIGPSICRSCYEVSEDVILEFRKVFKEEELSGFFDDKGNGKYQLDLWKANERILQEA